MLQVICDCCCFCCRCVWPAAQYVAVLHVTCFYLPLSPVHVIVLYIIRWPKAFCLRFNMLEAGSGRHFVTVRSFAQKLLNLMQFNWPFSQKFATPAFGSSVGSSCSSSQSFALALPGPGCGPGILPAGAEVEPTTFFVLLRTLLLLITA